jgi:hypothetical protein
LRAFHARKVALPTSRYDELRAKRDKVRLIIKRRLREMGYRQPLRFRGQGSVTMRTVTRGGWYGTFDIDDGIYFSRQALTGPLGGEMSPLEARKMVWEAAYSEYFTDPPEYLKNCVRVFYANGYHVDIPVYRVTTNGLGTETVELASSRWKPANPVAVTDWFRQANARSPGAFGERQLVRMVRLLKVWARSRSVWQYSMPSGFAITALVVECYKAFSDRDDRALLHLISAICQRLQIKTEIMHPVIPGEYIVRPDRDSAVRYLRERMEEALARIAPVIAGCPRTQALGCWNVFFNEDFFSERRVVAFV